jgi:hypothetical protein
MCAVLAGLALGISTPAGADDDDDGGNGKGVRYSISVTNLTKGQSFTPILAATHPRRVSLFEVGTPASAELEILAESGMTTPLAEVLSDAGAGAVMTAPGLLLPGETRTLMIRAGRRDRELSVAAMLIPTNDTFFALNGVSLPRSRSAEVFLSPGYDAGTEFNDQNCDNIPGPRCEGQAGSEPADDDEGFVGISNGFHDLGPGSDLEGEVLGPFVYDWRNPVARVVVRRVR